MAYGFLGLKPNEFWELQPKDIILMNEGFEVKRKYDEQLHFETLDLLRYIGYTSYIGIPTKQKKAKLEKYYPLRFDKPKKTYTMEEIKAGSNKREPYITNGKLRGYLNTVGELYDKRDGKIIAYMKDGVLEYIN